MRFFSAVSAALFFIIAQSPLATATSVPSSVYKRQSNRTIADCQSPDANLTPDCWNTLGIDAYLNEWWAANSDSCAKGEFAGDGFASCYQQKVGKGSLLNDQCDKIDVSSCRPPSNFSSYDPKEVYVLTSIFGVSQWFNSIFYATDFANGVAAGKIGEIVTTINPVVDDGVAGIVLGVLTGALAFLDIPAAAVSAAVSASVKLSAGAGTFKTVLQQAPGLTKTLLAPATLAGQFDGKNKIESTLSTVVSAFQVNIANGLAEAQRNFSSFLPLVTNGNFITQKNSLNASTAVLTQVLTTYITAQALKSKGYTVNYNLNAYLAADISNEQIIGRCTTPQNSGQIDQQARDCGQQTFDTISSKGWATVEDLVGGAVECALSTVKANGVPGSPPSLDPVSLKVVCISDLALQVFNSRNCVPRSPCKIKWDKVVQKPEDLKGKTQREFAKTLPKVEAYLEGKGI